MEASADVVVPGRRLGRRSPKNAPAIALSSILRATPVSHPVAVDDLSEVTDFGMYGNDQFGDCGPVSVANSLKVVSKLGDGTEFSITQEDVFALYKLVNPDFDPNTGAGDNGVDMQTMLELLLAHGIGGRKPVAFARVDVTNVDEVRAAIAYFGVVLFGVNLEVAQQAQTDNRLWDYSASGEWGGHAIAAGKYTSSTTPHTADVSVVTWAEVVGASETFLTHQLEEAWVVVWPEHLSHPAFLAGVDVAALAAAYKAITGKVMPVPTPGPGPGPAPVPGPTPAPGAAPFPGASDAISHRILSAAHRAGEDPSVWMNHHFDVYFKISE